MFHWLLGCILQLLCSPIYNPNFQTTVHKTSRLSGRHTVYNSSPIGTNSNLSSRVKQAAVIQQKIAEDLAEMDKPLTRTKDDVDVNDHLR